MARHQCRGEDACGFCARRIAAAEDARTGNHDIDGSMADAAADRYEREDLGL